MPKPAFGTKLPGYDDKSSTSSGSSMGSGAATPQQGSAPTTPILNTLNDQSAEMPQPEWGNSSQPPAPILNPNNNFVQQALGGANATGFDPNLNSFSGTPVTNTPSINSQSTPGFLYNQSQTNPNQNIIAQIMGSGATGAYG